MAGVTVSQSLQCDVSVMALLFWLWQINTDVHTKQRDLTNTAFALKIRLPVHFGGVCYCEIW